MSMISPPLVSVLVVDDEPALRKVIRSSLAASGFTVEEAGTGGEALGSFNSALSIWCCST